MSSLVFNHQISSRGQNNNHKIASHGTKRIHNPSAMRIYAWPGHDNAIQWNIFHRSHVNSLHKVQWRGAFDAFCDLRQNKRLSKQRDVGDLRRQLAHYDVTVMGECWTYWDIITFILKLNTVNYMWTEVASTQEFVWYAKTVFISAN